MPNSSRAANLVIVGGELAEISRERRTPPPHVCAKFLLQVEQGKGDKKNIVWK